MEGFILYMVVNWGTPTEKWVPQTTFPLPIESCERARRPLEAWLKEKPEDFNNPAGMRFVCKFERLR